MAVEERQAMEDRIKLADDHDVIIDAVLAMVHDYSDREVFQRSLFLSPPPNRADTFPRTRLSSHLVRSCIRRHVPL